MTMYEVITDISPFHGPIEVICKTKYKYWAWIIGKLHCWRHPYGQAIVRKVNMEIIIDEKRKNIVNNLLDPTSFETISRYLMDGVEGITIVMVIQDGYDIGEVASPFIVPKDDVTDATPLLAAEEQVPYMKKLLKEKIIRGVVPPIAMKHLEDELKPFIDTPECYDQKEAYLVALTPPIYWAVSMKKKWE